MNPFMDVIRSLLVLAGCSFSSLGLAELAPLADGDLSQVSGQGGIYLSGDVSINEMGGPVENGYFGRCGDAGKSAARVWPISLKRKEAGWCWTISEATFLSKG
ncbi:DUF6160 family protein [Marinobacter sp. F4216]|uniref:DUF6160 family protein n=1 Tax=Marinobacter sp. F4216 TaxID=2874281 RepID=UPI0039898E40